MTGFHAGPGRASCGAGTPTPTRSLPSLRARASDGSDLRVAVAGTGPFAVRGRSVEQSRQADSILDDVEPIDDAVASAAYRTAILPQLVREALDRLELA